MFTASRLAASLRHQLALATFHKFQSASAFILPCSLPSLVTVSIGALLISFHVNVSCLTSVQSRFTCSNPLRPVINKVYQQGVSTGWRLPSHCVIRSYFLHSLSFLLASRNKSSILITLWTHAYGEQANNEYTFFIYQKII